jgi:hypothetical protein
MAVREGLRFPNKLGILVNSGAKNLWISVNNK